MIYAIIILFVVVFLKMLAFSKIFEKMGENKKFAFIPFYNTYILSKNIYGVGIKSIFLYIPFLRRIFFSYFNDDIAKAFGKDEAFQLGLLFFNTIFLLILGFGKSKYIKK